MSKINAEEVSRDCYNAIGSYADTYSQEMRGGVIIAELVGVIRDCIMKDPERIAPVVEWVTQRNREMAKTYANDSAK